MKGLIGKKIGMTRIFSQTGDVITVTVINAGPCYVVQKKTVESDGYSAVQLGFEELKPRIREVMRNGKPEKRQVVPTSPKAGIFKKAGISPQRYLKEFRTEDISGLEVAQMLDVAVFSEDELVDVVGVSKGKGYAGGIKRHNFHGNRASHGVKTHRECGSAGANTTPGRTIKGKKLPGQLGNERVTVKNLRVIRVDKEKNLLLLQGAVPGATNGLLYIKTTDIKV
ncbi:MAG: 50S ribosomal protein L3 [Candidatus Wallbacteria bacterium]|nr:50S ribosomal protein L3 [Candidatus Wallbacteria bacterium]